MVSQSIVVLFTLSSSQTHAKDNDSSSSSMLRSRTVPSNSDISKRRINVEDGAISCVGQHCNYNPQLDLEALADDYPAMLSLTIDMDGEQAVPPAKEENISILCPFLRIMERYDVVTNIQPRQELMYRTAETIRGARKLGAWNYGVTSPTIAVSSAQTTTRTSIPGFVNYAALHMAPGVSHECGFTFDGSIETDQQIQKKGKDVEASTDARFNAVQVNDQVRRSTIGALASLQDEKGRLSYDAIKAVKLARCEEQGEEVSNAEKMEVGLMYTFLGGKERGFVDFSDVWRFFNGKLPLTIGKPSPMDFDGDFTEYMEDLSELSEMMENSTYADPADISAGEVLQMINPLN